MIVEPVTDEKGAVIRPDLLAAAEPVHRQLRSNLPADYRARLEAVFASGGEMAVTLAGGRIAGLAVFRVVEKTFSGRELYCDDLVTEEAVRSQGAGKAMMAYLARVARERGCDTFALDSGCQRPQAHKFYFREGLTITAFRFQKRLS